MPKFPSPTSYTGRKANQDKSGQARFATNAEAAAGLADDLIVSPLSMAGAVDDLVPDASLTVKGIVELATAAEMLAGTDTGRVPAVNVAFDYINSVAIAGAPAWSETVSGIGQLSTSAEAVAVTNDTTALTPLKAAAILAAPPAIGSGTPAAGSFSTLAASGLASLSGSATILTAGTALNLGSDNSGDAVNLGVGTTARAIGIGNSAAAHVVTIGSVTGASQVILNSGTAGIQLASTGAGDITINSDDTLLLDSDGVLELNSSAGVIGIGSDADSFDINLGTAGARTITVGNGTGATSVVLESGTGAIDIGANAVAHSVTIGNVTGASALVLQAGTGNFSLDGVAGTTYTIGASTTTGTMTIGGTAQTGTLTLGDSSGVNIVQIGSGEGATTVNIAGGATAAKVVNVATGAVANLVTIGSASGAASLDLLCGTGNFSLDGAATSDLIFGASLTSGIVTIGGTAQTGTLTLGDSSGVNIVQIGSGEGATTVNIAGGATAAKVVNVATGAVANLVTIGSASGAASMDLLCGTGNFTLEGATTSTYEISSTGVNTGTCKFASGTGARTVEVAGGGTGIKTVNIAAAATADVVTIGTTTGAGATNIAAGSGGINLAGDVNLTSVATKLTMNGGAVTDFIGQGTLVAGTVTIANTNIAATDRIFVTRNALNASPALGDFITTISAATSFTVASYDATGSLETTDVSGFDYFIVRQL